MKNYVTKVNRENLRRKCRINSNSWSKKTSDEMYKYSHYMKSVNEIVNDN